MNRDNLREMIIRSIQIDYIDANGEQRYSFASDKACSDVVNSLADNLYNELSCLFNKDLRNKTESKEDI